mmetsp:Transcript_34144/g.75263  ORF Transcript_34144/g.75263 Transcript_34144/m.75263 type:complete len:93 (-) Transcript_34144:1326-1604(-)
MLGRATQAGTQCTLKASPAYFLLRRRRVPSSTSLRVTVDIATLTCDSSSSERFAVAAGATARHHWEVRVSAVRDNVFIGMAGECWSGYVLNH